MNPLSTSNQVNTFLGVLDATDNTAGGGSASALAGAMAAGLAAMVAHVSKGPKATEPEEFYTQAYQAGNTLLEELMQGAQADSLAFAAVMDAYRLPKATEAEIASRRAAVQAAMIQAARVPLENARRCARASDLAAGLLGRSNPQAASDLQCAAYLAHAGLHGCLANVDINLPSIKDPNVAAEIAAQAAELRQSYPSFPNP
jgi:methenyltetrahydrofolate cyclohydrolase